MTTINIHSDKSLPSPSEEKREEGRIISELPMAVPRPASLNDPTALEAYAAELGRSYLPQDGPERQAAFALLYIRTRKVGSPPTELDVLKAFFIQDGDADKAEAYLQAFVSLQELGFPDDQITTALLLNNNNMEEALEYLMRHC